MSGPLQARPCRHLGRFQETPMPRTRPKKRDPSNTLFVELGKDGILRRQLEEVAASRVPPGEPISISRTVRDLIREAHRQVELGHVVPGNQSLRRPPDIHG
jgi:hypothetical protein